MKKNKTWLGAVGLMGVSAGFILGRSMPVGEEVLEFGDYTLTKETFYTMMRDEPYSDTHTFGQAMMEKVVLTEALEKRYGHIVTEELVAAEVEKMKSLYESEEAFLKNLEDNHTTLEAFTSELRFSGMVNQAFYEFHPIAEEKVKEIYEETFPAGVRIAHILVKEEETAKEVIAKLEAGETFADLAKEYSLDDETKEDGGEYTLLGGYFVPEVEEAAMKLKRDEYTKKPVKAPYGYHIIMMQAEGVKLSFEEEKEGIIATQYQLMMEDDPAFFDNAISQVLSAYEKEAKISEKTMKDLIPHSISVVKEQEEEREKRNAEYESLQKNATIDEAYYPVDGQSASGYAFMEMVEGDKITE